MVFLDRDINKLASNIASFSFVVNVDGITILEEEESLPLFLAVLAETLGDEASDVILPVQIEILKASLARTILPSVKEVPLYRVSGGKPGSGKPKAKQKKSSKGSDSARTQTV